jgi:enterochelin esterase-like enzyme
MDPNAALAHFGGIALQTSSSLAHSRNMRHIPAHRIVGEAIPDFIQKLKSRPRHARILAVRRFVQRASSYGQSLLEGSTAYLFYAGKAKRVSVTGEMDDWNPGTDVMTRVRGTHFHYLARDIGPATRIEYKLVVDSTWILDPYNARTAAGGTGLNSEIAIPGYVPPPEIDSRTGIKRGTIEAMECTSTILRRSHPVFVYLPHAYKGSRQTYPSLYVLDGGDYLGLGLMATVLDNLIASRRIRPIVAIFVEPRTDVTRPRSNKRTTDYTMSDSFVRFLTQELRPALARRYRLSTSARSRAIMGASLGGLLATYAAYTRPDVFALCAAQSPSYWWRNDAIIRMIARGRRKPVRFYLDTGTIQDSVEPARQMRRVFEQKGYRHRYAEHSEGHNWGNWRARIPVILEEFWGIR